MRSLTGIIVTLCVFCVAGCTAQQQEQSKNQVNQAVRSIPSPVKIGAQDAALTAEVAGAMAAQTGINAFNVKPSAHRGVVTLTGKVPTPEIKATLLSAVRRVHGVSQIVDRITIGR
ncbi:MAG: BON domain-containing protein [Candidatus Eremiobacteraeota bacterium]|nr:BON domain-containing protein [Candidatus Eremiobacteraeota bacterium]